MRRFFLCFFATGTLFAGSWSERLERSSCGDYLVFEADQIKTLLCLREIKKDGWIFEEISMPKDLVVASFPDWIEQRAPGHTSWSWIQVGKSPPRLIEGYSFSKRTWLDLTEDSPLKTLLKLQLTPVSKEKRRKIGPSPMQGEMDLRKNWSPLYYFEGKRASNSLFEVLQAIWPEDSTPLCKKGLHLYFVKNLFFPYWVEVLGEYGSFFLRGVDSGKNLPPFFTNLPKRPLSLIEPLKKRGKNTFQLEILSPDYYQKFSLVAEDLLQQKESTIPFTLSKKGKRKTLIIQEKDLCGRLEEEKPYLFFVIPEENPRGKILTTPYPFSWKNSSTNSEK